MGRMPNGSYPAIMGGKRTFEDELFCRSGCFIANEPSPESGRGGYVEKTGNDIPTEVGWPKLTLFPGRTVCMEAKLRLECACGFRTAQRFQLTGEHRVIRHAFPIFGNFTEQATGSEPSAAVR